MSSRVSYLIAVILLLIAAFLRLKDAATLPPGLSNDEITNVRIVETAREGSIEVFYNLGDEGREGLYPIVLAFLVTLTGRGMLGYRLLSIWAGMLSLAVVYAVGKRLFGNWAGLSAMGLLVVGFWPILLARDVSQSTLLPLLVVTTLLALMVAFPAHRRSVPGGEHTGSATALGVLLGLGLYAHPVGLLTLLFSLSYILYVVRTQHHLPRQRMNTYISFMLLMMIIIGMPYLISSIRHPDLSGTARLVGESPRFSPQTMVQAFGGVFIVGDKNPLHNLPGRPLFDAISGILILVGMIAAIVDWRRPRHILILLAITILSPVFLLPTQAPNFLNYASALPLLALFFGSGVSTIMRVLPVRGMKYVGVGLLALFLWNITWMADDLYQDWPHTPAVERVTHARLGRLADYIGRTADEIPTVICGWTIHQTPG